MIGSDSPPRPRCRSVALLATGSALLLLAATASLEATPLKGVFDYGAASTFVSILGSTCEIINAQERCRCTTTQRRGACTYARLGALAS